MKFTSNFLVLASLLFSATAFANEDLPGQKDINPAKRDIVMGASPDVNQALADDPKHEGSGGHHGFAGHEGTRQMRYASRDMNICPPDICDDEGNYRDGPPPSD